MGGMNSCCIPRKSDYGQRERHSTTPKAKGNHRRNLSATFNLALQDHEEPSKLDINTASEEELMTLPGINRSTAQSIIDYRRRIDGFKKIEDLAVVSGVGATKLVAMRSEICVSQRTNSHRNSGVDFQIFTPSCPNNRLNGYHQSCVDLNAASAIELSKIWENYGLVFAEKVLAYRGRVGQITTVNDLCCIEGISGGVLRAIRDQITVGSTKQLNDTGSSNNTSMYVSSREESLDLENLKCSVECLKLILQELKLEKMSRPEVPFFNYRNGGMSVVRVATWSLNGLTKEKISNPGVREIICRSILENGIGILAVQDITDKDSLQQICQELNKPTLPLVKTWPMSCRKWKYILPKVSGSLRVQKMIGFLFDESQAVDVKGAHSLEELHGASELNGASQAYLATFRVNQIEFVAVNVHLKFPHLPNGQQKRYSIKEDAAAILQHISDNIKGMQNVLILGNFGMSSKSKDFDILQSNSFVQCFPANVHTDISSKEPNGTESTDHLWVGKEMYSIFTGNYSIVKTGLSHPLIPDNWSWGGLVSNHCPCWAEFYVTTDTVQENSIDTDSVKFTLN